MWLKNAIEKHPQDRIALDDGKQRIAYGYLLAEIKKYQERLNGVNVLGIVCDNSVEWILWDLAALMSKIPCVPLPSFFTKEQIEHSVETAHITHIVSSSGLKRIDQKKRQEKLFDQTVKVTFTSGTTAKPKGVCLSSKGLENVSCSIAEILTDGFIRKHLCVLPFSILLENIAGVYTALICGSTITIPSLMQWGDSYQNIYQVLKKHQAESIILVPEILKKLIEQTKEKGVIKTLRFVAVGGAKLDPDLIKKAHLLGIPVYEGYGLSEAGSVVSMNTPLHHRRGTTGQLLPHVRAYIEQGELCLKNQGFLGYIGQKALDVIQTGDMACLEDGFLSITGRKTNIIITSFGRNISPEWIESVLLGYPKIQQAIVYGEAQPNLNALIVTEGTKEEIAKAIHKLNKTLPAYAHIHGFQIVKSFTTKNGQLTGNGRPKRDVILSTYINQKENRK